MTNRSGGPPRGDMDGAAFRKAGHELVDWIATYLEDAESYPVLSRVRPGDVRDALPSSAPENGESFEAILADALIIFDVIGWSEQAGHKLLTQRKDVDGTVRVLIQP